MASLLAGCGPRMWRQPRLSQAGPTNFVPSDASSVYRAMGLLTDSTRLRFVGSLRYLAGATRDSTLAVLSVSLRNSALTFEPQGGDFIASYHVDLTFRSDSGGGPLALQVPRDETVRVNNIRETQRRDESVVFQEFVAVRPGTYSVSVVVRDANSPAVASAIIVDTVPSFAGPSLGSPIPVYEGSGRTRLGATPLLVVNPRGMLRTGTDSLRCYIEGYHWKAGTRVVARFVAPDTAELWRDTLTLTGDTTLAHAQVLIRPGQLPLGRGELRITAVGAPAHAEVPLVVGFSDRWAVANIDQLSTLLRYFSAQDLVDKLHTAPREQRAAAWHELYHRSDPDSTTPQNEALDEYLRRIETANQRYSEPMMPGWQTDRGEVLVTLGEPDQTFDMGGVLPGLRWEYTRPHLSLVFKDVSGGMGMYRLTTDSRIDFEHATEWVRRTK